jgi:hypothetical protein
MKQQKRKNQLTKLKRRSNSKLAHPNAANRFYGLKVILFQLFILCIINVNYRVPIFEGTKVWGQNALALRKLQADRHKENQMSSASRDNP